MGRQYLGREGAYLKRRYFVRQFSTSLRYLVIDLLHLVVRVVQNGLAGEQEMQWEKTNKGNNDFKWRKLFVRLVPVRRLLSKMLVLYHVNDKLQRTFH